MAGPFEAASRCTRTRATSQSLNANPGRRASSPAPSALNTTQAGSVHRTMRTIQDFIGELAQSNNPGTLSAKAHLGESFVTRLSERSAVGHCNDKQSAPD